MECIIFPPKSAFITISVLFTITTLSLRYNNISRSSLIPIFPVP